MIEHQNKQKDLKDLQEKNKNEKRYILYFIGIHNFGLVHLELTFLFSKKKEIENSSEWWTIILDFFSKTKLIVLKH